MKALTSDARKASSPQNFNSRLAAYSATATAALLVTPAVADAQVINITGFTSSGSNPPGIAINSNIASHPNVQFAAGVFQNTLTAHHPGTGGSNAFAFLNSNVLATSIGQHGSYQFAKKFATDSQIGGSGLALGKHLVFGRTQTGAVEGPFGGSGRTNPNIGYIGFKTVKGSHTYYGWLRIRVDFHGSGPTQVSLVAKDGDPGVYGAYVLKGSDTISAGEVAPTPEPSVAALGGLSLLACGAAGVRELRRRRQTEAKTN